MQRGRVRSPAPPEAVPVPDGSRRCSALAGLRRPRLCSPQLCPRHRRATHPAEARGGARGSLRPGGAGLSKAEGLQAPLDTCSAWCLNLSEIMQRKTDDGKIA